jgi:hypothetical protein
VICAIMVALGCDGTAVWHAPDAGFPRPEAGSPRPDAGAADRFSECPDTAFCVQSIVASPETIEFGCVAPDEAFAFTVWIENRSDGRVGPLSVSLSPVQGATLSILTDECGGETLEAWRSCRVTLFLMTSVSTQFGSELTVTAPRGGFPVRVPIRGQVSPMASKLPDPPPPPLDFGQVKGGTERTLEVVMTNISDAAVVRPVPLLIDGYNGFRVDGDSCSSMSIPPLGTCSVTVTFAPTAARAYQDILDLNAGDACGSVPWTRLTGTGIY